VAENVPKGSSFNEQLRAEFAGRYGDEAADYKLKSRQMSKLGLGFAITGVGGSIAAATGARAIWLSLVGLCMVGMAIAQGMIIWYRRRAERAIARELDIQIDRRHPPPPSQRDKYLVWCETRELTPDPFKS